jgi:tape measure domain-containing protein
MAEDLGGGDAFQAGNVWIGIQADVDPFYASIDAIASKATRVPVVRVEFDHGPLTAGNQHIESKFTHVVDVNRRLAQNAITPQYDGAQVNRLTADIQAIQGQVTALQQQRIQLEASLNADSVRAQLDAIANQPRAIYYTAVVQMPDTQAISAQMTVKASVTGLGEAINPELKKAFKDAAKEARSGNLLGAIGSVAAAPFKLAGGAISQAVGGAVFGLGQQLTNDFSKGLTTSIGGKLAGSVGSPALLGEKAGDLLANLAGSAREGIVAKAKQANTAIDKALAQGTLEFGTFSLPIDSILPIGFKRPDLINLKKELSQFFSEEVKNYFEKFEQIFPDVERQAEAAAQRAKVTRRRQSVAAISPQQIIDENQARLQELARQRARGNNILINKFAEVEGVRGEVRAQRREASSVLKDVVRANNDPKLREEIITQAAEDIPQEFEKQVVKLRNAYNETLEKINAKNAEIAKEENESAALGIKPNQDLLSRKRGDITSLQAQAVKQQEAINLQQSTIQQEVDAYLSAARGETDAAPILAKIKSEVIKQVKALGEPLVQVQREKVEVEQALRSINAEISRLSDSSFSVSSPAGRRLVLEKQLKKQQGNFAKNQNQISNTQESNELLLGRDSLSKKDADLFGANVVKIAELEKKQQRIQKQITKTQTELSSVPGSSSSEVRKLFKEIFSELGFKGKEPEIIVDSVKAAQVGANAFYDTAANAIVIPAELNNAIKRNQLNKEQKGVLREEIIHSVQLDSGSAKALEGIAEANLSGEKVPSVVRASIPTSKEVQKLSPEIALYQRTGKGQEIEFELEAKVLRDRLAAREKNQATVDQITQSLTQKVGFSGTNLESQYSKYLSEFIAEVNSIKRITDIDSNEIVGQYIDVVSKLSDSAKQYLEQLARLSVGQVDANEAAQIEKDFDQQVEEIAQIYKAKNALAKEIEQLSLQKAKPFQPPVAFEREKEAIELAPRRETVGGAISAVTDSAIIPAAKQAGNAIFAVGKAGYKAAEGLESLVLDLIPGGRTLKATTKFAAKNIALPTAAAIAVSRVPGVGGLEQVAVKAAGDLVSQLVGLTRSGIASQVQAIVSQAIPSFIPGSQNIVATITNQLTSLATGVLDATGTATAEGLATVLSGSAVLNVLKKSVDTGVQQASKGLSAAGSAIANNDQVRAVAETQIPFELPTRERVLEFAENAGVAARQAEDKTIQFAESTLKAIKLLTINIPDGQNLADLGLKELQTIKSKLAARFDEAADAERQGRPVIGGSDVIRGDIKRVQQVIEAKAEVVPTTPKITKTQYENDLKKIIQAESKQIEKLRSQLIESLRSGATSDALQVAEQLKSSSQSALGKLEAFKGNQGLDLESGIAKSVNGYISRFKDLISQAESATAKVTTGEDFGTLLSINTEQIAERFVGLINKLFEVEGKNLQDALGKAALSPRAQEIAVAGAGIAGGVAGRQLGIVSGIGGEVTGAVAMRGAVNVGEQAIAARNELLQTELYQTATALEKLQQIVTLTAQRFKSPEVQAALGKGLTGDLAGSGLGNLSTILGNLALPGAGTVTGAIGGIGGAGQIQSIRDLINDRISQSSGGIGDEAIFRSIDPSKANYSAAQVEILQQVEKQLAEIQRLYQQIENGAKRVAAVEADIANTEGRNRRNLRFNTVEQDRNQRAAALKAERLKTPQNDLSQFLSRVPGTSGGGRGPRVPGPPTLFIPEIQPTVTAFDVAKKTASGFLGIIDKIPAPIKSLFALLGGGFIGFQAFQILTSQANQSYEAVKRLESQKVVVNFATGSTAPLEAAEKQAKALGTNLVTARDSIKSLAIQAKNTPLEQKVVPIFEGASTAAAALQLNPEQQGRLYTAFNQIAGKGTVQSEELRQQLGELGVSFQLAARAAGVTTNEFNKQLAAGAVLSQDFLPKFANQLKLELGGAAIAAGDSLQGLENKVANASTKLQESLGKQSIPLVSTGLKSFAGVLDFAANNVSTLTTLINVALVGALLKGGQAFKNFALAEQLVPITNSAGKKIGEVGVPRVGVAAQNIKEFVQGGGIKKALTSDFAKDLGGLALQAATISAGIGVFQTITEGFTGGERYQEFNKVLETTEKRIQAINAAERDRLNLKNDKPGRTGDEVRKDILQTGAGAIGDLLSLDFKGFFKKNARNVQQIYGGDPTTALSEGFFATQEQADNRSILNNASDLIESRKYQDERSKAFGLAGRLKNNQAVNPDELKASRETIQSRLDLLKAVPEDLRKIRPEINAEIKQLEELQKALGGTGSAYSKLVKAAQEFENIISKQNALEKAVLGADASRGRAEGATNEFDAKVAELEAQSTEANKNRAALRDLIDKSEAFLGSQEFAAQKLSDPDKAEAETKRLLELKTQFAGADKQIDDLITQDRLEGVNRRVELLQREATEQERAITKIESLRRVRTTKRDAVLAEGVESYSLTPQALRLQQSKNTVADTEDAIAEQEKKRQNAIQNLKKAQSDLRQINPNDEQQFEQGKAAVAQYEQAVSAAEAEINGQRKTAAEAVIQYRSEIEEQLRQQLEITSRKNEQSITKEIQAIDRVSNAQKRRVDNAIAGYQREQKVIDLNIAALDRVAKLSGKRAELSSAINQGAQIPLNGLASEIKDAEGLIAKLKDKNLDPATRGRTQNVLDQLGISNNEQDAFRYRVETEDRIAKLKAESLSAEIIQSQITLDIETRKEEFAAKRAIIEAEITKQQAEQAALSAQTERRKAEAEVRKSDIGVRKAEAQLGLAQLSGDPNKIQEAQLNLEDARISKESAQDGLLGAREAEKLAKDALPNATLSVVDALENFAATIEGGKLSQRILGVTNQNKANQFNTDERSRRRGLAIEGIDKGVEVNINNGGANGFDPFGFRESRAKDALKRQQDIARFQNNIRGIPNGSLTNINVGKTSRPSGFTNNASGVNTYAPDLSKLDSSKYGADAMKSIDTSAQTPVNINFSPVTDTLKQLVTIEERLSAQILALAGRERVQIKNTANYAVREPVLRDSGL